MEELAKCICFAIDSEEEAKDIEVICSDDGVCVKFSSGTHEFMKFCQ